MARDIYQEITNQIVEQLEAGVRPWHQPWSAANMEGRIVLPLRHNGVAYRGVNVISLWMTATLRTYASPTWMTFKQAIDLGGCVRKGEKGTLTVYADSITRTETDKVTGEDNPKAIHFMKGYTVFNVEQIDGLPDRFYVKPAPQIDPGLRIAHAEAFFTNTGARIIHGGSQASYSISADHVRMPPFEAFESPEAYYATLAHECTHWTRHESRLGRDFGRKRFGDEGYAMEELVAELGAAFTCASLALAPQPRDEHAEYIAHWLTVLKNDKRAIFSAASFAQRAADYLDSLQPRQAEVAA